MKKEMKPDFSKYADGLMPAIVQDNNTGKVLMLGFMNQVAYDRTVESLLVTFWSRSKNRIWVKGEESGNHLHLKEILLDCDNDTFLVKAESQGPVCHTGTDTCWGETNKANFIFELEKIIQSRKNADPESSYTAKLFSKGINKVAQKVGEEAVEVVIEAKDNNKELFLSESADLLFHYLILLTAKGFELKDVVEILEKRHLKN